MNVKAKFQEILVKFGGTWSFNHVKENRLEDDVVNTLIREEKEDKFLLHYIKFHTLSTDQITMILQRDKVGDLMLAVVRIYVLTPKQQEIVLDKNNVLLLEAYLCPKGFFEANRRFNTLQEYLFIYKMVKSEKLIGAELFKTYVDNTYKTLLTEDIIKLLVANENTWACKYIFHRAKLKREWEEDFVMNAPDDLLLGYIDDHDFGSDAAQVALVKYRFAIAKVYYQKYKLRGKAQPLYHELRQEEVLRKKAEQET